MDGSGFDDLVRALATRTPRRRLLRGLLLGGTAASLANRENAGLAAPNQVKTDVCHLDPKSGNYSLKSLPAGALPDHLAHGDALRIDCCTDAECIAHPNSFCHLTPGGTATCACSPDTCTELGHVCGSWPDGCGGSTANCGSCPAPDSCSSGVCTDGDCGSKPLVCDEWPNSFCNPASGCDCIPETCATLGFTCGTWSDGCGGSTGECGTCTAPDLCTTASCSGGSCTTEPVFCYEFENSYCDPTTGCACSPNSCTCGGYIDDGCGNYSIECPKGENQDCSSGCCEGLICLSAGFCAHCIELGAGLSHPCFEHSDCCSGSYCRYNSTCCENGKIDTTENCSGATQAAASATCCDGFCSGTFFDGVYQGFCN